MKDDYGYFGKGVGGYIHYMQAQDESNGGGEKRAKKSGGSGGGDGGDGSLKIVFIALAILAVLYLIGKIFG